MIAASHDSRLSRPVANGVEQFAHGADADAPRWYAVYTWSRHEKVVERHLLERGIPCFLPLYESKRQWNKRTATVSLPLFPGYVFIQTSWRARHRPLEVPGVVQFVGAAKSPSEIPGEEIEGLRNAVTCGGKIEPHPYLTPGKKVRITSGPMAGITGTIERTTKNFRIIISVDMIMRSVAVELDSASLMAEA